MAGDEQNERSGESRRCPRCEVCSRLVRVQGVGREGVWCKECLSKQLPIVGLVSESEFRGALREYREGLDTRAEDFAGMRLDPFGEEMQGALGKIRGTLKDCAYVKGNEFSNRHKEIAKGGGCSLSLLCHNIRSAKGPGLELLESELRGWGVGWDIIGLCETWLDSQSEKTISVEGYGLVCASRKLKVGGGVALLVKEGCTYK